MPGTKEYMKITGPGGEWASHRASIVRAEGDNYIVKTTEGLELEVSRKQIQTLNGP